jgi:hypothetical protein
MLRQKKTDPPSETTMEMMIWASAFVAAFERDRRLYESTPSTPGCKYTIDDVSGFHCAEIADVVLEKYREAMTCDDAQYLIPVQENWEER